MNKTYTILIADDDPDDQELIADALKAVDVQCTIIKVQNGMQVLDYLMHRQQFQDVTDSPDLIFLDLNMPLLDGFEVLRGIRMHQALAALPVYVITISSQATDKNKALDLGATGFYSKGSQAAQIAVIVKEILAKNFEIPALKYL